MASNLLVPPPFSCPVLPAALGHPNILTQTHISFISNFQAFVTVPPTNALLQHMQMDGMCDYYTVGAPRWCPTGIGGLASEDMECPHVFVFGC